MKKILIGLLVLLGLAFIGMAELTGNQSTMFMLPAVNHIYSVDVTNLLAVISTLTVALALLFLSLGFASRMTARQSVIGLVVMAIAYGALVAFLPPAGFALMLLGVVGFASIVIAFVRQAAENVETGLPIAPNQVVGGALVILSQVAPVIVAACGQAYGARATWLGVAVMLVVAAGLGWFLLQRYSQPSEEAGGESSVGPKRAWTIRSSKAAVINGLSAMAVGSVLGPLTANIALRHLPQATWVGFWGLGSIITGVFMMAVWSSVTPMLKDRGLILSAVITLAGGVFALIVSHYEGGAALVAGGLVVSLGANTFEGSLYAAIRPTSAEAVTMNFGRALCFGLGAFIALQLLASDAWVTMSIATVATIATVLLRERRTVERPLTFRSVPVLVSLLFGLVVAVGLVVVVAITH